MARPTTLYDLHPIVRKYAYARLANPAATHEQLASYFNEVPQPEQVLDIADLQPTIELFHHLARAEKYDEAQKLFRDRLVDPLYFQLGAYLMCIELLRVLLPSGEGQLSRVSRERAQAWTLNSLAGCYAMSGQSAAATPLIEQYIAICEKRWWFRNINVAIGLVNLANLQLSTGTLTSAVENIRRSIALCREMKHRYGRYGEASGHRELGRLLALTGDWEDSIEALDIALEMFSAEN